jgi:hypothetical protein
MTSTTSRNALAALLSSTTETECGIITAEFDAHDVAEAANAALLATIHSLTAPAPLAAPLDRCGC